MADKTLAFGARGARVTEMQHYLQTQVDERGIPLHDGLKLGRYDETTQYAVSKYQKIHNIAVTGKWDAATQDTRNELAKVDKTEAKPEEIVVTAAVKDAPVPSAEPVAAYRPVPPKRTAFDRAVERINPGMDVPGVHVSDESLAIRMMREYRARPDAAQETMGPLSMSDMVRTDFMHMRERHPVTGRRLMHEGDDFDVMGNADATQLAPMSGIVLVDRNKNQVNGVNVKLYMSNGDWIHMLHFKDGSIPANLQNFSWVDKGDMIGTLGGTGRVTGAHMHVEYHRAKQDGRVIDGTEDFERVSPSAMFPVQHTGRGVIMAGLNTNSAPSAGMQMASAESNPATVATAEDANRTILAQIAAQKAGLVNVSAAPLNPPLTQPASLTISTINLQALDAADFEGSGLKRNASAPTPGTRGGRTGP